MLEKKLSIHFTDPLLEVLPPSECDRSVWALQLSTRARNSLARLRIISVGQFIRAARRGITAPRAAGLGTVADLESSLQALSQSVRRDGCIDWERYFDNRRIHAAGSERRLPRVIPAEPYALQLNSVSLDSLMPLWRESSINILHPSHRASNCLQQIGVNSVGALVDMARRGIKGIQGAGPATIAEISKALHALSRSVQIDGSVDWLTYAADRGFVLLPEKARSELTLPYFLKVFPEAARRAVESRYHFAGSFVLRHYLFVDARSPASLEKIARRLNWTKQGVALLKDKVVTMLKRSILDDSYVGCRFRFRPAFLTPLRQLRSALSVAGHRPVVYSEWQHILAQVWGITPAELGSLANFFLNILDYHFVHPKGSRFQPIILPKGLITLPFTAALPPAERLLTPGFPNELSEAQLVAKLRQSAGRNPTAKEISVNRRHCGN